MIALKGKAEQEIFGRCKENDVQNYNNILLMLETQLGSEEMKKDIIGVFHQTKILVLVFHW